jgi:hypothetical protein
MNKSRGRLQADDANYKLHSEDGVHFLTDTNPAPTSTYYGFIVTGSTTNISSITYIDDAKVTGSILDITMVQGGYYPISSGFSTITLASGDMMLLKKTT